MNEVTSPTTIDDAAAGALMLLYNYNKAASRSAWAAAFENSQTGFDFTALAPIASADAIEYIDDVATVLLDAGLITKSNDMFDVTPDAREFLENHGLFQIREA